MELNDRALVDKLPRMILIEHMRSYSFQFYSSEGRKLLTSIDFTSAVDCVRRMMELKKGPLLNYQFEKSKSVTGQFFYTLKDHKGYELGSSEWYWSEASCEFAWKTLIGEIFAAEIMEE
jgi:uncharacterized protein YegP (UPF0339 family)